jgi:hypothetical protein
LRREPDPGRRSLLASAAGGNAVLRKLLMKVSMPRILYIHVGPRKTATSTLQAFLRDRSRPRVIYPKVGLYGDGSHHRLVYRFFGNDQAAGRKVADIDSLLEKLAVETRRSENDIIISSEVLSDETRDAGAFIRSLMDCTGVPAENVRILFACREHFERAASWYNMRVRAPKHINREQKLSPDEFLDAHGPELCYAALARRMKKTGLRVTALNYHPSESWVPRFLGHIGFREDEIPESLEKQRTGLSAKALIATIATNKVSDSVDERRGFLEAFSAMPGSRGAAGFIFGSEAADRAELIFGPDRNYLREEFGIELGPPDRQSTDTPLSLSRTELDDIIRIAQGLGPKGIQIIELATPYLRD